MVFLLLVAAGGALVLQNLAMSAVAARASSLLIPLLLNSITGLCLFLGLLLWQAGPAGLKELAQVADWRAFLPGLLGSFFVLASLMGYQRLGAASTIALLIASQLACGLLADAIRFGPASLKPMTLFGALLLAAGAALVVSRAGR
ncbi:hypothetical protein BTR14_07210 [Rhizobium rhizosphaerae]|uniref:DMT family transporter n=1 Tax=Xaviernesmea rhizosphaerae TaxID=1672749 RepID=A0ABX3PGQ6_9HYPH|nr:DMT family transporter [Xaviernesmea rhizosphaerae]OQP87198.1 hypothetical protein BTR14_07210 [Xaviernesmea rhizosphaerae]